MADWTKELGEIPAETQRVARNIYPKGNLYMQIRDELEGVFKDSQFADMYLEQGRPALSPSRLAMVLILQYVAGYSDRQTCEAVRDQISWKYALSVELTDTGFDHSVLSDYRTRLLEDKGEEHIFDSILNRLQERDLLKGKSKQRTDATHVLASIRNLNRIELVGETMRMTLNRLAQVAPNWLATFLPQAWIDRYSQRFNDWHLPKEKSKRQQLVNQIGTDGYELLNKIYQYSQDNTIRNLPEVEGMRRIWVQQFWCDEQGTIQLRDNKHIPRGKELIESPFDLEARYSTDSHGKQWIGYKTHFTETCATDAPRLITHVHTCSSTDHDSQATYPIQSDLKKKALQPREHYLDSGYASVRDLMRSQEQEIQFLSPMRQDTSWQALQEEAFDISHFEIDWETQQVTCPQGNLSRTWSASHNQAGDPVIHIQFTQKQCQTCPVRERCTTGKARALKIRPEAWQTALMEARHYQQTDEFWEKYRIRSGIEGTFSVANRNSDLRHTPFVGLQKTHFHCLFSAIALNLKRAINWINDVPIAITRKSPLAEFATAS